MPPLSAPLLFLGHAADRTGPPVYLLHLLRWLEANRPEVDYEIALLAGGPLERDFRDLAPTTVYEGHREGRAEGLERALLRRRLEVADWWWATRRARQLRRQMARYASCRVVYVNSAPSVELARHLPPGDRVLLSHVHELEVGLTHRCSPSDRGLLLEGARQVFSVADAVTRNLVDNHRVDPSVITHHPGMVERQSVERTTPVSTADARAARGLPREGPVVGSCGTTDWRKAVDLFLRMAWQLSSRDAERPITFVWIGGDDRAIARATEQAAELGIGGRVHFVGVQPDPLDWFRLMDVFVLPSREDPFPLVCLEAASVGRPLVTFDNGGMPELARKGCGLVATYPDVDELTSHVDRLLDDPSLRRSMGERGRELVRAEHDVSVLAPRLWADVERWLP